MCYVTVRVSQCAADSILCVRILAHCCLVGSLSASTGLAGKVDTELIFEPLSCGGVIADFCLLAGFYFAGCRLALVKQISDFSMTGCQRDVSPSQFLSVTVSAICIEVFHDISTMSSWGPNSSSLFSLAQCVCRRIECRTSGEWQRCSVNVDLLIHQIHYN